MNQSKAEKFLKRFLPSQILTDLGKFLSFFISSSVS